MQRQSAIYSSKFKIKGQRDGGIVIFVPDYLVSQRCTQNTRDNLFLTTAYLQDFISSRYKNTEFFSTTETPFGNNGKYIHIYSNDPLNSIRSRITCIFVSSIHTETPHERHLFDRQFRRILASGSINVREIAKRRACRQKPLLDLQMAAVKSSFQRVMDFPFFLFSSSVFFFSFYPCFSFFFFFLPSR